MGNNCVIQKPTKQISDANDEIGVIKKYQNFCAPSGSAQSYLKQYLNDEYETTGEGGSCFYDSIDPPSEISGCSAGCKSGHCAIIGRSGTYARKRYSGDPLTCCITGRKKLKENETCNPIYRDKRTPECNELMYNYCYQNDNVFSKVGCKQWCEISKRDCDTIRNSKCNIPAYFNKHTHDCLKHCSNNAKGKCDISMREYCTQPLNKTKKICSCINSDKTQPLCVDKNCIYDGYITQQLLDSRGEKCEYIDCSIDIDITKVQGNVNFTRPTFIQHCGGEGGATKDKQQQQRQKQPSGGLREQIVNIFRIYRYPSLTVIFILIILILRLIFM